MPGGTSEIRPAPSRRPDLLGQEFAVDDHGQRLAHVRTSQRLALHVECVVIGAEIGRDMHLVANSLLQRLDLLGRQVGTGMHLARLEAAHAGGPVLDRQNSTRSICTLSASWKVRFLTSTILSFGGTKPACRRRWSRCFPAVRNRSRAPRRGRMDRQAGLVGQKLQERTASAASSVISSVVSSTAFTPTRRVPSRPC
jgi:hypothetical protein